MLLLLDLRIIDFLLLIGIPIEDKRSESLQTGDKVAVEFSDLSDLTSGTTSRRQLDAGTLDAKVVKALKKQEEKREKRTARKKEVC